MLFLITAQQVPNPPQDQVLIMFPDSILGENSADGLVFQNTWVHTNWQAPVPIVLEDSPCLDIISGPWIWSKNFSRVMTSAVLSWVHGG